MKKALTIVLALAMVLSLCLVGTFAEGEKAMKLERVASNECALITVVMGAKSDVGMAAVQAELQFDNTQLEVVAVENLKDSWLAFTGPQNVAKANELGVAACFADASTGEPAQCPTEADMLKVTFKVLEGAPEKVTLKAVTTSANDYDLVKLPIAEAVLEVETAPAHTPGAAATCGTAQTCTVCGAELAPATGEHVWEDATCIAPKTCKICKTTEGTVNADAHKPGDPATCGTAQICELCKKELAPATGDHHFVDGVCKDCEAKDPTYVAPVDPKPEEPGNEDNKPSDNKPSDNKPADNKPADNKPSNDDKKNPDTSDVSVFAFAGVASLLAGAAVVAKKKF